MRGSGATMHGGAGHGPPFLRGLCHLRPTGAVGGGATMLGGAAPSFRRGQCPTLHGAIIGRVKRVHLWQSGVGEGTLAQGVDVAGAGTRRSKNTSSKLGRHSCACTRNFWRAGSTTKSSTRYMWQLMCSHMMHICCNTMRSIQAKSLCHENWSNGTQATVVAWWENKEHANQ